MEGGDAVHAGKRLGSDSGRQRVWLWGAVILSFAVGASLVSLTSGVSAVWVMLLILCGCIVAPLQLLVPQRQQQLRGRLQRQRGGCWKGQWPGCACRRLPRCSNRSSCRSTRR